MNHEIGGIGRPGPNVPHQAPPSPRRSGSPQNRPSPPRDRVDIGRNGKVTMQQAVMIITERSMEHVRQGIGESREALRIPGEKTVDPVPDAAAGRIMVFALEGFEQFQRTELKDMDAAKARQAYAGLLGPAVRRGIAEAETILTALNALNANVRAFISEMSQELEQRIADFVDNGDG